MDFEHILTFFASDRDLGTERNEKNFSTSEACKNVLRRPGHMFKVFRIFYNISAFERTNFRDRTRCRSKFKADLRDIFMILLLWTLLAEKLPDVLCFFSSV